MHLRELRTKKDLTKKRTTYTWKKKVDVSTAGNKKGTVVVTYPDGSKEEVEVTISVVDKKAPPNKPQEVDPITEGDQIVTGKTGTKCRGDSYITRRKSTPWGQLIKMVILQLKFLN